jgi:hypothetical protein
MATVRAGSEAEGQSRRREQGDDRQHYLRGPSGVRSTNQPGNRLQAARSRSAVTRFRVLPRV